MATKREIRGNANVWISKRPAFAVFVKKDHPKEVVLLRVVDKEMSPPLTPWCLKG